MGFNPQESYLEARRDGYVYLVMNPGPEERTYRWTAKDARTVAANLNEMADEAEKMQSIEPP